MRKIMVLLVTMILMTSQAAAQYRTRGGAGRGPHRPAMHSRSDYYHFIYGSASLGYTSLEEGIEHVTPVGGLGNNVGLGYEFRYRNYWLSVGGQLNWIRTKAILDNYIVNQDVYFENAIPYEHLTGTEQNLYAHGQYNVRQTDSMNVMMAEIPLMMGYYFQGFYVGAGAKVSFGVNTRVHSRGTYDFKAKDDRYQDMIPILNPENENGEWSFKTDQQIRFKPMVSLCGEIGYDVLSAMPTRSPFCHVLKVGFYFEVGLSGMIRTVEIPEGQTAKDLRMNIDGKTPAGGEKATDVGFNPYFTSGMTMAQRVAPFYTGLKITYMFGGSRTSNHGIAHRGCQCYQ